MAYNIAVAGATGAVGREMLQTLAERNFPVKNVHALASKGSVGREVSYGEDRELTVEALDDFDFSKVDIALFSAGGDVSKSIGPKAGAAGAIVIDNSSAFRMDEDVPLVVPEVNGHVLDAFLKNDDHRNIIANPKPAVFMSMNLSAMSSSPKRSRLMSSLILINSWMMALPKKNGK